MLDPADLKFHRRFCINPCYTLRLPRARMDLYTDPLAAGSRGDPYPVTHRAGEAEEAVSHGRYTVTSQAGGEIARLLCCHHPYHGLSVTLWDLSEASEAGFCLRSGEHFIRGLLRREGASVRLVWEIDLPDKGFVRQSTDILRPWQPGMRFMLLWSVIDVAALVQTDAAPELLDRPFIALPGIGRPEVYSAATDSLFCRAAADGQVTASEAEAFFHCGAGQADLHVMRYEDGTPIFTDGRLYFTLSTRAAGEHNAVVSWDPSGCDLRMEGCLFFDQGDGEHLPDGPSSVIYDRRSMCWYVWEASFLRGHVLCRGSARADLRHGVHYIPVRRMEPEAGADPMQPALSDDTLFLGKFGDEDPDLVFDAATGLWNLAICRVVQEGAHERYCYHRFVSRDPLDGFVFADRTSVGSNTGGSFVRMDGRLSFVCGSDFGTRALYHVFPADDFSAVPRKLSCDFDDGGFRGWGTVIALPCGDFERYLFFTFDRVLKGEGNWSYGNLYAFEADRMRPLPESFRGELR